MSGAVVAIRGTAEGAQAATRAGRKNWLASLQDEAKSFVKGDNNSPWAILAETVIGCVPILGQLVDARDIIKGLVQVSGAPTSPLGWFNLITALIGLVPGSGSARLSVCGQRIRAGSAFSSSRRRAATRSRG